MITEKDKEIKEAFSWLADTIGYPDALGCAAALIARLVPDDKRSVVFSVINEYKKIKGDQ